MKHLFRRITIAAALTLFAALFTFSADAQVTGSADIPRILSYQGQVTSSNGSAMNGTHQITATLYEDRFGLNQLWQSTYNAEITGGIFNILLGSGISKLPETAQMNRPLWVGIKVDGGDEMKPLSQLTAAPYAINIPDQSVTFDKLAPNLQSAIFGSGSEPRIQSVSWDVGGNTLGVDNWIGSLDDYAVEIHVYDNDAAGNGSKRVMRYEPNTHSANIIGGYQGNTINSSNYGSVICGGGVSSDVNTINSNFSGICSGKGNTIGSGSNNSFILGGASNTIGTGVTQGFIGSADGANINNGCQGSVIIGGQLNTVQTGGTTGAGKWCSIPGGDNLTAQSYSQTVIGHFNTARGTSIPSSINGTDPLLIVGNGTATNARSNAFEVLDNGTTIVSHTNGSGGTNHEVIGATHADNIIYAWGRGPSGAMWPPGALFSLDADFGVAGGQVMKVAAGQYLVGLNIVDTAGTGHSLSDGAVIVTALNGGGGINRIVGTATTIASNSFTIFLTDADANVLTDAPFYFIVTGRP